MPDVWFGCRWGQTKCLMRWGLKWDSFVCHLKQKENLTKDDTVEQVSHLNSSPLACGPTVWIHPVIHPGQGHQSITWIKSISDIIIKHKNSNQHKQSCMRSKFIWSDFALLLNLLIVLVHPTSLICYSLTHRPALPGQLTSCSWLCPEAGRGAEATVLLWLLDLYCGMTFCLLFIVLCSTSVHYGCFYSASGNSISILFIFAVKTFFFTFSMKTWQIIFKAVEM